MSVNTAEPLSSLRSHPLSGPVIDSEPVGSQPQDFDPRRRTRFGVAFRLLASFIVVTVFAAGTSALALYAFHRYRIGFDRLVANDLPALAAASQLAQRSERLSANAPALAVAESHFARQAVGQELSAQLRELSRIAAELPGLSVDPANLSALQQHKEAFARNLAYLDKMVAQRIDAAATAGNALTRLGILAASFGHVRSPAARAADLDRLQNLVRPLCRGLENQRGERENRDPRRQYEFRFIENLLD
jgi:hypothetical protein